jgi:hypothetical protein
LSIAFAQAIAALRDFPPACQTQVPEFPDTL